MSLMGPVLVAILWLMTSFAIMAAKLADQHATVETQQVYHILRNVARDEHKVMFGQQMPTWYGAYGGHAPYSLTSNHGSLEAWEFTAAMANSNHSDELCDMCSLVGDFPAVVGMDFNALQKGADKEAILTHLTKLAHARGSLMTMSWHSKNPATGGPVFISDDDGNVLHSIQRILPGGEQRHVFEAHLDKVAAWANSLQDAQGRLIPVIFRPWHEATGSWFWWGLNNGAHNTAQHIITLYQSTVEYLRDTRQVNNCLYAFSPSCPFDDTALSVYPGDDYVDVLGMDCYQSPRHGVDAMVTGVGRLVQRALLGDKVAALTEVGVSQPQLTSPKWFTQDLLKPLTRGNGSTTMLIAYMNTWVNWCLAGDGSCSIHNPYPCHPAAADFRAFYNDYHTMFLSHLRRYASWFYD